MISEEFADLNIKDRTFKSVQSQIPIMPLHLPIYDRQKILANKKSQSALEYMMTYGWAILIIVIVAAVLYSFGIFSPSSSISATITGFSGLGSVQA